MKSIPFEEVQRMAHWWLWLVLTVLVGLFLFAIYQQLFVGIPFGQNPMTDTGLVVFAIVIAGLVLLVLTMRLRTEINEHGFEMTHAPSRIRRFAAWEEIRSVKRVRYGFVGYGIH